jgi:hypothetical protein
VDLGLGRSGQWPAHVLNALLTPANRPESCGFDFCPTGETCTAGACQYCVCVDNQKYITNATCCTNGVRSPPC